MGKRAHFAIVSHRACFSRSVYPEHMSLMSHTYTSFSPEQMASTFNQHQQCVPCHAHAQAPSSPTEASFQVMAAIKLSSGVVLFSTPEFQSMARLIGQENQTLGLWHLQKMFCQNLPQGTRCMYETITVGRERVDLMSVTKLGDDTLLWMVVRVPSSSEMMAEAKSSPVEKVVSGESRQTVSEHASEDDSSEDQSGGSGAANRAVPASR